MRVGVLGGTFDPVHKGHLHLATQAQKRLALDQVLFIPAYLPPHKEERKEEISSPSYRYAMLKLALAGKPSFKILDVEIRKRRKVYTVETLRELRRLYPTGTQFYLLTGADNFRILDCWKDLKRICELCQFVIANRPGFKKTQRIPPGILWLPIPPVAISATEIRERVKMGKPVRRCLPPGVAQFILKKKLYRIARAL